ncbi:MAG: RNA polymerase sigma factor [Leptospirales bacterium]|nr:RNA polymerase sigma factor [Leptospirales bacterium]
MHPGASDETQLVERARAGDRAALDALLLSVRDWVYNVIRRVLLNPQESEDATQEVLLKVATNLAAYDASRARFRTWAYRIAINHSLNARRGRLEEITAGFDAYAQGLREVADVEVPASELANPENLVLVAEAKASCTLGMLLCLDREQRIALILSDFMGMSDLESADLIAISHDAFRKRLSRARRDLYQFMDDKCGLINEANPCRCNKKMKGFQMNGWIDPANPRFSAPHLRRMKEQASELQCEEDDFQRPEYRDVFRDHPYFEAPARILDEILARFDPGV